MIDEKFNIYEKLLREWNQKINLVAASTITDIKSRHIDDSAQLEKYIEKDKTVIDMGSGAGFPSVVLAILGYKVIAIESIGKKANFLELLKKELNLTNLEIIQNRVEITVPEIIKKIGNRNIIFTARAFAPLVRILDWTTKPGNHYILLKGKNIQDEIIEAKNKYRFNEKLYKSEFGDGYIIDFTI